MDDRERARYGGDVKQRKSAKRKGAARRSSKSLHDNDSRDGTTRAYNRTQESVKGFEQGKLAKNDLYVQYQKEDPELSCSAERVTKTSPKSTQSHVHEKSHATHEKISARQHRHMPLTSLTDQLGVQDHASRNHMSPHPPARAAPVKPRTESHPCASFTEQILSGLYVDSESSEKRGTPVNEKARSRSKPQRLKSKRFSAEVRETTKTQHSRSRRKSQWKANKNRNRGRQHKRKSENANPQWSNVNSGDKSRRNIATHDRSDGTGWTAVSATSAMAPSENEGDTDEDELLPLEIVSQLTTSWGEVWYKVGNKHELPRTCLNPERIIKAREKAIVAQREERAREKAEADAAAARREAEATENEHANVNDIMSPENFDNFDETTQRLPPLNIDPSNQELELGSSLPCSRRSAHPTSPRHLLSADRSRLRSGVLQRKVNFLSSDAFDDDDDEFGVIRDEGDLFAGGDEEAALFDGVVAAAGTRSSDEDFMDDQWLALRISSPALDSWKKQRSAIRVPTLADVMSSHSHRSQNASDTRTRRVPERNSVPRPKSAGHADVSRRSGTADPRRSSDGKNSGRPRQSYRDGRVPTGADARAQHSCSRASRSPTVEQENDSMTNKGYDADWETVSHKKIRSSESKSRHKRSFQRSRGSSAAAATRRWAPVARDKHRRRGDGRGRDHRGRNSRFHRREQREWQLPEFERMFLFRARL